MDFLKLQATPRVLTYTEKGLVKEEEFKASSPNPNVAQAIAAGPIDRKIMISTDAASKVTEKAVNSAFKKWATEAFGALPDSSESPNISNEKVSASSKPESSETMKPKSTSTLSDQANSTSQKSTSKIPLEKSKSMNSDKASPISCSKKPSDEGSNQK